MHSMPGEFLVKQINTTSIGESTRKVFKIKILSLVTYFPLSALGYQYGKRKQSASGFACRSESFYNIRATGGMKKSLWILSCLRSGSSIAVFTQSSLQSLVTSAQYLSSAGPVIIHLLIQNIYIIEKY